MRIALASNYHHLFTNESGWCFRHLTEKCNFHTPKLTVFLHFRGSKVSWPFRGRSKPRQTTSSTGE